MKSLKSQSGQLIIESILLMTVLLAATVFTMNYFKQNSLLSQLVSAPWVTLAGMLQNADWASVQASMTAHPNNYVRHESLLGDQPQ